MTLRLFFVLTIVFLFTPSCGDNLLYFAADKGTNDIEMSAIDIAFIQGNCEYVKQQYEKRYDVNKPFTNPMDRYRYGSAILACTGYDLVNNLSLLLGTDQTAGGTQVDVMFGLIGAKEPLSLSNVTKYRQAYTKVLEQCGDAGNLPDESFSLMCGFASSADTIMAIAFTVLNVSGKSTIPASGEGLTNSMNDPGLVASASLKAFVSGYAVRDTQFLPNIERDYYFTDSAIVTLENISLGSTNYVSILKEINDGLVNAASPELSFVFVIVSLLGLT